MTVTETDLELLETYLDDELSAGDGDALRRRLASEPALAQAMDQLRQDRELRQLAFGTMEPAERQTMSASETIARSLRQAATREVAWTSRLRILRQVSAAAACIVVGLLVGWFARSNTEATQATGGSDNGAIVFSGANDSGATARPVSTGGFNVQITDDAGRVLAVQHFDTLSEAREFSNDLSRWQTRQRQMRSSDIRLIGDDF
jgi:anti-sigma factor RsiW